MLHSISTKFEINVTSSNVDPIAAADFAQRNRCPAVVVHPEYIAQTVNNKIAKRGNYSIIATVDFPKGQRFSIDKLNMSGEDIGAAEGYDVLLSTHRSQVESNNEMRAVLQFLRSLNPVVDLRWSLKMHTDSEEDSRKILENLAKHPCRFVRVDPHLDIPNVGLEQHKKHFALIREFMATPIKLSGNLDLETVRFFAENHPNCRFDVTMEQAVSIVQKLDLEAREADEARWAEQRRREQEAVTQS